MMEDLMNLRRKYLSIISGIAPVGAVGVSLLLGSTLPGTAAVRAADPGAAAAEHGVAERLAAIREAVFIVAGSGLTGSHGDPNIQLVWGNRWFNGGWNRRRGWGPPWGNWRNFRPPWNNFWRNW
jgi:hypothetical protein